MATPRTTRPAVREAEVRTEPAREPVRAKQRTHRGGAQASPLKLPEALLRAMWAEGIDLQWNSEAILGEPATQFEHSYMQQQGWEPITIGMFGGRFDYLMPKGTKGQIIYGGSRLDWRPRELTEEARAEDLAGARRARHIEESKLRAGTPDGVDTGFMDANIAAARKGNFLNKEYAPSAIPD